PDILVVRVFRPLGFLFANYPIESKTRTVEGQGQSKTHEKNGSPEHVPRRPGRIVHGRTGLVDGSPNQADPVRIFVRANLRSSLRVFSAPSVSLVSVSIRSRSFWSAANRSLLSS